MSSASRPSGVATPASRLLSMAGLRMPVEDSYIAATARRHGLTIVTGNDQDFRRPGLKVFNPFTELP
jgi:predicted nucleic acid-binding protein